MALQGHCTEGKIILIGLTEKRDRYSGGEKRRLAEKILPFISTFFLHEMKGVVNVVYNSATYKMRNAFFVEFCAQSFTTKILVDAVCIAVLGNYCVVLEGDNNLSDEW